MFMAPLCTTAETWKQPKCPSTDNRLKKTWYTHTQSHSHTRVLTTGLPGPSCHTHFKDEKPVLKTIAPYTGIALRAGPKVTDQVQLGHHRPQLWAREPQMGRASSGPNVSQPGKDLRGQEGLSLDDDSTPPR